MPQQDNVECEYEAEGVTNYYQCNTVVSIIASHQVIKSQIPVAVPKRRTKLPVLRGEEIRHCLRVYILGGGGGRGGVPLF